MPSPDIRGITFDAAGTLIHLAEPVGTSYSRVAANYDIISDPATLGKAFSKVWKRTPLPFSDPTREEDPHEKSWWSRLVREVFKEAGAVGPGDNFLNEAVFDKFFEALYLHFESPGTWKADHEAFETLEAIRRRFRCIVLSNFDARLRTILDDLDLLKYFETCLLSCELGASKPDSVVFEAAANSLQLPPEQIIHVGDDPVCDWRGAEAAGFAHFRVGREESKLGDLIDELSLARL